ncbi:MAG TPA: thioredoxin-dependent thiol peroxidase [Stenomitos sp.]
MSIQIGSPAPEFSLSNAQGEYIHLSQFRGQWVIVYFYPKDNTPGCTKEACGFRDHFESFQSQNIQILGISPDGATAHQKFIAKHNLPFTLLCDPDASVAKAYESYGPKQFMGKQYEGVYRQTFVIDPTGVIVKIYRKVKAESHAGELLDNMRQIMTPS